MHDNPECLINYICDKGYTVAKIFGTPIEDRRPGAGTGRDFIFIKN